MRSIAILTGVLGGIFLFLVYAVTHMTAPTDKEYQFKTPAVGGQNNNGGTTTAAAKPIPQDAGKATTPAEVETGGGGGGGGGSAKNYCDLVNAIHGTNAGKEFGRNLVPVLRVLSESVKPFKFVQIGAHVGGVNQSHDDTMALVQQYEWHGILVEPSPPLFAELTKKYSTWKNLYFEPVGVSNNNATMTFYAVNSTIDPYTGKSTVEGARNRQWFATQLGTFDVSRAKSIMRSLPMTEVPVDVVDFSGLIERHTDMADLHYLLIDTEGFDYKVLSGVDFFKYRPLLVVFEHNKLSSANKRAALERLKAAGYDSAEQDHQNTMAFRRCSPEERQRIPSNHNVPELLNTLTKSTLRGR